MGWNPWTHHTKLNRTVRIATKTAYVVGLPLLIGLGTHLGANLIMGPPDLATYAEMSKELLPNIKQHLAAVAAQQVHDPVINPDGMIPGQSGHLYPFEEIRGLDPEQAVGRMKDYVNMETAQNRSLPAFVGWFSAQLTTGFSMLMGMNDKFDDFTDRIADAIRPQGTSHTNRR